MATALAERVPVGEIRRLWVFPPLRREEREWGTAVAARELGGGRFGVYTASYVMLVRGREKGRARVEITEVAAANEDVLVDVLKGVEERAAETEPPVEIPVSTWYGALSDESAAQG